MSAEPHQPAHELGRLQAECDLLADMLRRHVAAACAATAREAHRAQLAAALRDLCDALVGQRLSSETHRRLAAARRALTAPVGGGG